MSYCACVAIGKVCGLTFHCTQICVELSGCKLRPVTAPGPATIRQDKADQLEIVL